MGRGAGQARNVTLADSKTAVVPAARFDGTHVELCQLRELLAEQALHERDVDAYFSIFPSSFAALSRAVHIQQ
jgi:hypothetical protein